MPISTVARLANKFFNINASNGGGKFNIDFEMHSCPMNYVSDIVAELSRGFRSIDVLDSETGEVAISLYFSDEMFEELCPPEMCIDMVRHMCDKRGII